MTNDSVLAILSAPVYPLYAFTAESISSKFITFLALTKSGLIASPAVIELLLFIKP